MKRHRVIGERRLSLCRNCRLKKHTWKLKLPWSDGILCRRQWRFDSWRVRARSSSFCNLSVTAPLCQGILLADIPAIIGSLDVVMEKLTANAGELNFVVIDLETIRNKAS